MSSTCEIGRDRLIWEKTVVEIRAEPVKDYPTLCNALLNAIKLEHATIPPYLTAMYSLRGTSAGVQFAKRQFGRIVRQEMLHMTLACNVLNAIGGAPKIADKEFIPEFPGPLPMGIEGELTVHIQRYSRALIKDVFMKIEEPEMPLEIPTKAALFAVQQIRTIGEFYSAIRSEIMRQGVSIFTGDRGKQVQALGAIQVTDPTSAIAAINTIVVQGEGTPCSPISMGMDLAHYYTFEQLDRGMKIVSDPGAAGGFSFDPNQPIEIDDVNDVYPMVTDPRLVAIDPNDHEIIALSNRCDQIYSQILRTLDDAFNGHPDKINDAIDLMSGFSGQANLADTVTELISKTLNFGPHNGENAGPHFEFA